MTCSVYLSRFDRKGALLADPYSIEYDPTRDTKR